MLDNIGIYDGVLKNSDLEQLARIENIFSNLNYTDHQLEVAEIESLDNLSDLDKGLTVISIYIKHMDVLFIAMGIYLEDDEEILTLRARANILEAVVSIEDPENHDIVATELEGELVDARDDLCDLLAGLSEQSAVWYQLRIQDVDVSLIERIRKNSGDSSLYEQAMETVGEVRAELLRFMEDRKEGPVFDLVVKGGQLPINYVSGATQVTDEISTFQPIVAAWELYALTIAAAIEPDLRVDTAKQSALEVFVGLKATQVSAAIESIHEEHINAQV